MKFLVGVNQQRQESVPSFHRPNNLRTKKTQAIATQSAATIWLGHSVP